jgi:hypothetical protein
MRNLDAILRAEEALRPSVEERREHAERLAKSYMEYQDCGELADHIEVVLKFYARRGWELCEQKLAK